MNEQVATKQTRFNVVEEHFEDGDENEEGLKEGDLEQMDKFSDQVSFMTGSTGKSSFNMNKFFISPTEQRELSTARGKIQRYDERINAECQKIQDLKNQILQITQAIAESQAHTACLQLDEEALKLEFIQAKLIYEMECRKKQMQEQELKNLRKVKETRENDFLRKGWRLQKAEAIRRKQETKTSDIVSQVSRIQSTVDELSEDVHHYKSLDKRLKSSIHNNF